VDVVNANGSSSKIYDRVEALALGEVFGPRLPDVRVHSIKSMLGQHGAGSSMLQVVATCLTLRRGTIPPTINHDRPDPACGPLRVVTHPETVSPRNAVVHSIGLGGFYYSVGAFRGTQTAITTQTGAAQVKWSATGHPIFRPANEFERPLTPWAARRD
jgi:3-oxoacyl-(acyl-carrier-protein) synthase